MTKISFENGMKSMGKPTGKTPENGSKWMVIDGFDDFFPMILNRLMVMVIDSKLMVVGVKVMVVINGFDFSQQLWQVQGKCRPNQWNPRHATFTQTHL